LIVEVSTGQLVFASASGKTKQSNDKN